MKRRLAFLLFLALALGPWGCSSENSGLSSSGKEGPAPSDNSLPSGNEESFSHRKDFSEPAPPMQPPAKIDPQDLKELVRGNNEFALDLYARLAQTTEGNIVFSPFSISTALAMTYAGARGNTAKQMAQTLHFDLDSKRLHPTFGHLIRLTNEADKKRHYELAVANSLWGDKGLSLNPQFLRLTQTDYQAGFQFADFVSDAEEARRRINGWVEQRTQKKIEELLAKGLINANTRLVLVNAIYFMGDWSMPFPKEATRLDYFTIPGAPAFKVPMMNRILVANGMDNEDFQLAQLRYKDDEFSMVVILPKKKDGLAEVEKKLSAKALAQALALARAEQVEVALPKFKMANGFFLEEELYKLGMKDAFTPGVADFSGLVTDARKSLCISTVVHKAFVEVDEKGTEAAGATGVILEKKSGPLPFRADHPFLFFIRHNATGSILFVGRVIDPRNK